VLGEQATSSRPVLLNTTTLPYARLLKRHCTCRIRKARESRQVERVAMLLGVSDGGRPSVVTLCRAAGSLAADGHNERNTALKTRVDGAAAFRNGRRMGSRAGRRACVGGTTRPGQPRRRRCLEHSTRDGHGVLGDDAMRRRRGGGAVAACSGTDMHGAGSKQRVEACQSTWCA